MVRRLRCPSCQTTVRVEPGAQPVCPTCGFGSEGAAQGAGPSADTARSMSPGQTRQHAAQSRSRTRPQPRPQTATPAPPASERPSAGSPAPATHPNEPEAYATHEVAPVPAPASVPAPAPSPPPKPPRPETIEATGLLEFGSPHVPDATLYDDEEVLVDLETRARDIGLWHTVLGHKERVIVTSRRVFGFTRTRNEARLRTLEIGKVSAVESGGVFHMGVWATGAVLLFAALLLAFVPLIVSLYLGGFSALGLVVSIALATMVGTAGVLTMLRATAHGVSVHAGATKVELPLHPSRGEEVRRLVDSIQRAIRAL